MENRFFIARKKCNLTQSQVAAVLGIKDTAISKWECGRTLPDGRTLKRVADLYGVSSDYLLGLSSQEPGIFDDARLPKTHVQELFDQLSIIDQGRILGKMELMIEEYSKDQTSTPTYQEQKNTWGTL